MTINAVPAPDRLPERLRRCVDQTIAAEALEGWHPTADHIEALIALVNDDVTFDDYLADFRAEFHDIRGDASYKRDLAPDSYAYSQKLASGLLASGSAVPPRSSSSSATRTAS